MPGGLDHDLRLIAVHPAVRAMARTQDVEGGVTVIIEIDLGLGSRFLARERGENGVRPVEDVTLRFPPGYPAVGPFVRLRPDFKRNLPHMLPAEADLPPAPCVIDGPASDFIARRGMAAFVDQIVGWLNKAAHDVLIDPNQGWEPIRRDHDEVGFVADPDHLRSLARRDGGGHALQATSFTLGGEGGRFRGVILDRPQLGNRPLLQADLGTGGVPSMAVVVFPKKASDGAPVIHDSYDVDAVRTVADVFAAARRYGSNEFLAGQMNLVRLRLARERQPFLLWIILFARRPMRIRDQDSDLEMIAYVAPVQEPKDAEEGSAATVFPARHHDAVTRSLLQRMSDRNASERPQWTLIGAGSLGSKMALHLARQGDAPDLVLDRATMLPHNYARHALLPAPLGSEESGLSKVDCAAFVLKAELLASAAEALGQKCEAVLLDVARADAERLKILQGDGRCFVLDATASDHVLERLCATDVVGARPRLASASLLGAGAVGRLLLEGSGSNPDGLEAEALSLALIERDAALARLATQLGGRAVAIGQGCVSLTATMSDARLSAMAAPLCDQLTAYLDDGLPKGGELVLGALEPDGLSRTFRRLPVKRFRRLTCTGGLVRASLSSDLDCHVQGPTALRGRMIRRDGRLIGVSTDPAPDAGLAFLQDIGWIVGSHEEARSLGAKADAMTSQTGTCVLVWREECGWRGMLRTMKLDGTEERLDLVEVEERM